MDTQTGPMKLSHCRSEHRGQSPERRLAETAVPVSMRYNSHTCDCTRDPRLSRPCTRRRTSRPGARWGGRGRPGGMRRGSRRSTAAPHHCRGTSRIHHHAASAHAGSHPPLCTNAPTSSVMARTETLTSCQKCVHELPCIECTSSSTSGRSQKAGPSDFLEDTVGPANERIGKMCLAEQHPGLITADAGDVAFENG